MSERGLRALPTLDEIRANPETAQALPPATRQALTLQALAVLAALATVPPVEPAGRDGQGETGGDRALTIDEAAQLLQTSKDTLYRKWRKLSFAYKDPVDGHVKFSFLGIQKHLRQRQGPR